MKPVSILDIASKTGFSRNTVAKALRGDTSVSEKTRRIVIQTAYEMDYQKLGNQALKEIGLSGENHGMNFAVLVSKSSAAFWNNIVMGVSDEINTVNGTCQISFIGEDDERALILPRNLLDRNLTGIICLYAFCPAYIEKILELKKPVVFLDISPEIYRRLPLDVVLTDGFQSVYQITGDLISRGRRKIGFIGDTAYCQSICDRYQGFLHAMEEASLPVDISFCRVGPNHDKYYRYEEVKEFLSSLPELPEALVCANDHIAQEVYRYCREYTIRIPEDMAVTGFDNLRESNTLNPPLTTVRTREYSLGKRLVQQLLWRMENPDMPRETLYIRSKVLHRESSGTKRLTAKSNTRAINAL